MYIQYRTVYITMAFIMHMLVIAIAFCTLTHTDLVVANILPPTLSRTQSCREGASDTGKVEVRRRENSAGSTHFLSFSLRVKSGVEEVLEAWAESGAVAMSTSCGELRPED